MHFRNSIQFLGVGQGFEHGVQMKDYIRTLSGMAVCQTKFQRNFKSDTIACRRFISPAYEAIETWIGSENMACKMQQ